MLLFDLFLPHLPHLHTYIRLFIGFNYYVGVGEWLIAGGGYAEGLGALRDVINAKFSSVIFHGTKIKKQELAPKNIFLTNETSLKTSCFGLKPSKWLIFNSPVRQLADWVIDILDNQGFSHSS